MYRCDIVLIRCWKWKYSIRWSGDNATSTYKFFLINPTPCAVLFSQAYGMVRRVEYEDQATDVDNILWMLTRYACDVDEHTVNELYAPTFTIALFYSQPHAMRAPSSITKNYYRLYECQLYCVNYTPAARNSARQKLMTVITQAPPARSSRLLPPNP